VSLVAEYIESFGRCYPHKKVEIKGKMKNGELLYRIIIDKDPGDILLNGEDMRVAIRGFNRGR
jgi:hypothetical protein